MAQFREKEDVRHTRPSVLSLYVNPLHFKHSVLLKVSEPLLGSFLRIVLHNAMLKVTDAWFKVNSQISSFLPAFIRFMP